jgi:O-antigen/teichoic acid export membrane protein
VVTVRRYTPLPARFAAQPWSGVETEVWSFSAALLGIGMMEFFIVQVDKISLGYYLGAREVGIYSVAAAVVAYVPLVLHSVNQIFSGTIADLHTRGEHAVLARLFQSLTKWVVSLTLPLATVIIVFARPLMRVFGHDFEAGWPILVIGTAGQLINCGVGSVGFLLLMSGNQKRLIRVQAGMTVVMIGLSVTLIPLWGIVGAAVAAAITNIGMNVWNLLEVRSALGISPYNRSYFHLFVPTSVMLVATVLMKKSAAFFRHDWLAIGCALFLAYAVFSTAALSFGLDADDRLIAQAIWVRVRRAFGKSLIGMGQ